MREQRTLKKRSGLVVAIVVTVVILCTHNVAPTIAQEKTEYDYGGGDWGDYGSDYGQNGLYDNGDIVIESNTGEGTKPNAIGKPYKVRDDKTIAGEGDIANDQRERERQAESREITRLFIKELKNRIAKMDDKGFKRFIKGKSMRLAFPVISVSSAKPDELFWLDTVAVVHQVYKDAARVLIDRQWVWIDTKAANSGAEFNARKGRQNVGGAKTRVNFLALRQKTRDIEGTFCIPIRNVQRYLTPDDHALIKEHIEGEKQRRIDEQAEFAEEKLRAKNKKLINRLTKQLKRNFSTKNKKWAIEAAAVGLTEDSQVALMRWDNKKIVEVPIHRLNIEDQNWIIENKTYIQRRGPQLAELLQTTQ